LSRPKRKRKWKVNCCSLYMLQSCL